MYRILIAPVAQRLLRTLPEPLVSRVGHVMAKAADEVGLDSRPATQARAGSTPRSHGAGRGNAGARAASTGRGRLAKLEVEGLALTYAIDPVKHTLTVRRIAPA